MAFISVEKHCSVFFFAAFLFSFREITFANNNNNNSKQGTQVAFRSLFVEQETGRLFIVYEVKIKSYCI